MPSDLNSPVPQDLQPHRHDVERLIIEALDARLWALQAVSTPPLLAARFANDDPGAHRVNVDASRNRALEYWNAMTLVSVFGALEAHIEALTRGLHDMVVRSNEDKRAQIERYNRTRNRAMRGEGRHPPGAYIALTELGQRLSKALLLSPHSRLLPELPTADKWEDVLKRIYLRPIEGRPLPDDLRATLNELGEVRNVLLHRMGRMDQKALDQVSEGPWRSVGERVVIDAPLYERYIAALTAYSEEIFDRVRDRLGEPPLSLDPRASSSSDA
jgi:hypothetical protein